MWFAAERATEAATSNPVLKIDFHIHTSDDPVDHIVHNTYGLIDRAAALRFHALAITLHDRQLDEECLRAYARDRGILLLPGIERTIAGKHVVLVNFPSEVERLRSFDELRALMDVQADLFDAVEWSYFWTPAVNLNAAARRWAQAHGTPRVGNSDLHD